MTDNTPPIYRILAVDDDPAILDLYEQILNSDAKKNFQSAVFDLDCCTQGKEAVEAVRLSLEFEQMYAVIFLDLKMPPGPDGEWAAQQILKLDPYTNIVLVSGFMRSNSGISIKQPNTPDKLLYLQKPFHRQEILQFATALSAKWQAETELRKLHQEMESLVDKRTHALLKTNKRLRKEVESHRETEKALHMSESNFSNMIHANADGILILDENAIVRFMNPAAESIFGTKARHFVGQTFEHLISPEEPTELDITIGDGTTMVAEMRVMETEWQGQKAYLASLRDITDRKGIQRQLQLSLDHIKKVMDGTIRAMALAVEMRDPYTSGHQHRVAELAQAIAREINLPAGDVEGIYMAASIHDIGKISLPAEILSKPVRLTDIERKMIQAHSQMGYEILKGIDFAWPIAQTLLQHHERIDGSGYPHGLGGEEILIGARILGVSDVVETMASHRPYRPSIGLDKALEEISDNRGKLYDEEVVSACLKLFNEKGFEFSDPQHVQSPKQ
ncbi:MAG: HD domain-containing phosphohydrolase [Desulfobacterales bacterium]|jgi:HD-GYP domain-containing protein (c-di-GMP phosphodiesterase class II)